jgi:hypothetical protein
VNVAFVDHRRNVAPADLPTLLRPELAAKLAATNYATGHGVADNNLGLALLYYALPSGLRARLCVCLGSGGGLVPALTAQAQRDLKLAGARTILVDAVLPEAGYGGPEGSGGWFDDDSLLRSCYPEVWLVTCRTDEAARDFFSRYARKIDYLHIDADHSATGVLTDIRNYLPFLSEHAVITLHDTRLSSVSSALATFTEELPNYGLINFPDVGQGTAVLRPVLERESPVVVGNYMQVDRDGTLVEMKAVAAEEAPALWSYLTHPALFTRHAIVSQFLGKHDTVLEIGGYVTPVGPFLKDVPNHYWVIDPLCQPASDQVLAGQPCQVRQLAIDLDEFDTSALDGHEYAVVFLGAQLDVSAKTAAQTTDSVLRYLSVLAGSTKAIVEFPPAWSPAKKLLDVLISVLRPKIELEVTLDLSQNDIKVGSEPVPAERLIRQLFVLSEFQPLSIAPDTRERLARILFGREGHRLLRLNDLAPVEAGIQLTTLRRADPGADIAFSDDSVELRTPPIPWGYAAVVEIAIDAISDAYAVEVDLEVIEGTLYLCLANAELTDLGEQKAASVTAGRENTITLEGLREHGRFTVLFRNGAQATRGFARINQIRLHA